MGKLKVLPANIANMIAAGEVVQRPASVVKELMENAIDAGATQVDVVVADAGRTLVQVIDNGSGMSAPDAVLCFERHATSKIATADDLEAIGTYGFRGEALASIAAVAEVTLRTRREKDDAATQVTVSDFGKVETSTVSAPVGSNFAVRNLFYNTPARRKFLKSDAVEMKHIVEEFTRVALTRPEIGFSLRSNGKDVFILRKAKSLKFRVLDLLGASVVGDIVDVQAQTSIVQVGGFVARPDTARKTVGNQFFFVNGRYFRSAYLHKAVMKAYEGLIPEGLTPSYFLWLEVDPHTVDVNIHPTKTEVKFEEDNVIFQIIYACVKETLGRNAFGAGIDFDTEGAVDMPSLGRSFEEFNGPVTAPAGGIDESYNPFDEGGTPGAFPDFDAPRVHSGAPLGGFEGQAPAAVDRGTGYGRLFEENSAVSARALVIKEKIIATPAASGLMLVNIRRAWERILYERALAALAKNEHVTQNALFPVQVQVGTAARLLFDTHAEQLAALGFDISAFGTDTVVVNGVPEGYSCEEGKVRQMVQDLTLVISEDASGLPEVVNSAIAAKYATLGSLNAEAPRNAADAMRLVDSLFACGNAEVTPGGKRIISIIPVEELEKKF
ncbi:MAG: DNA mismatch repair endonuclease MutL [Bacteroidales bacterium]|nr:DNA mismatch repair endonuclease MutL [Bacteroidales bacterium]